jgi:hypothetical protein
MTETFKAEGGDETAIKCSLQSGAIVSQKFRRATMTTSRRKGGSSQFEKETDSVSDTVPSTGLLQLIVASKPKTFAMKPWCYRKKIGGFVRSKIAKSGYP